MLNYDHACLVMEIAEIVNKAITINLLLHLIINELNFEEYSIFVFWVLLFFSFVEELAFTSRKMLILLINFASALINFSISLNIFLSSDPKSLLNLSISFWLLKKKSSIKSSELIPFCNLGRTFSRFAMGCYKHSPKNSISRWRSWTGLPNPQNQKNIILPINF